MKLLKNNFWILFSSLVAISFMWIGPSGTDKWGLFLKMTATQIILFSPMLLLALFRKELKQSSFLYYSLWIIAFIGLPSLYFFTELGHIQQVVHMTQEMSGIFGYFLLFLELAFLGFHYIRNNLNRTRALA